MVRRAQLLTLFVTLCTLSHAQFNAVVADTTNTSSITGNVITMAGHPVVNARVELRDLANGTIMASTYSQPNGSFKFTNVPNSSYEIVAISGIVQCSERVTDSKTAQDVELRLSTGDTSEDANAPSISVAAMKVPDKARKEYEKASKAFDKHQLQDVTEHLRRALEIYPNYAPALMLQAMLLLNDSNIEDAKPVLQHAIDSDPSYPTPYVAMASVLTSEKKYDDALRALDRAVPLAPNMWQIYFEMGKALLAKGDFQRSLTNLDRAESMSPSEYGALHLLKAHALLGLKEYGRAIGELEKYLTDDPSGPDSDRARNTLRQAQAFVATATAASAQ